MGAKYPGHVIFTHVVSALPPRTLNADAGDVELSQYEKEGLSRMKTYQEKETGYVSIQSTKVSPLSEFVEKGPSPSSLRSLTRLDMQSVLL